MFSHKIILFFLISTVLLSCTSTKSPENPIYQVEEPVVSVSEKAIPTYQKNRETVNAKGKVKTIFCISYKQFVPNSWLTNYVTKEDYTFDINGNISEETCYLEDERFHYRYKYSFDKKGNCLRTVSLSEDNENVFFTKLTLLNKEGLFISSKKYGEEIPAKVGSSTARTVEYRHKYELISDSLVIYDDLTLSEKYTSSYKIVESYENGNLMSATTYSEDEFLSKVDYRYDGRSNMIFRSDSSGIDLMIWNFKYDENNRQTYFSVRHDQTGVFNETLYTYDQSGNQIKRVTTKKGVIDERDSYTDTYTYDSQNNWTKRVRRKLNGDLISVLKRKVTYY